MDFVDEAVGQSVDDADGRLTRLWDIPAEHTTSFIRCSVIVARELGVAPSEHVRRLIALEDDLSDDPDEQLRIDAMRLRSTQRQPEIVTSYFQAESVRYAAG